VILFLVRGGPLSRAFIGPQFVPFFGFLAMRATSEFPGLNKKCKSPPALKQQAEFLFKRGAECDRTTDSTEKKRIIHG
jgi:hypothetical protein